MIYNARNMCSSLQGPSTDVPFLQPTDNVPEMKAR
jgi:hypothetical protein